LIYTAAGVAGLRPLYPPLFMTNDHTRLQKLKFRAWRRGFREADLILGPFADHHVHAFSAEELDLFEQLLEVPDHDLYEWIVGRAPTPAEFDTRIMILIKEFRDNLPIARGDVHGG
jgi:antitoxin CptB